MKHSLLCSLTEENRFFRLQIYHLSYSKLTIIAVSIILTYFLITNTSPRKRGRLSFDTQKYLFEKRMPTHRLHQLDRLNTKFLPFFIEDLGFFLNLCKICYIQSLAKSSKNCQDFKGRVKKNPTPPHWINILKYKTFHLGIFFFYLCAHICLKPFKLSKSHVFRFNFSFPISNTFGSWGIWYIHFAVI